MNPLILAILMTVPVAASAQVLTPAPVPNREADRGAPADRAGRPDGAERSAPFSGLPSSLGSGTGQGTPSTLGAPEKDAAPTPSVSR